MIFRLARQKKANRLRNKPSTIWNLTPTIQSSNIFGVKTTKRIMTTRRKKKSKETKNCNWSNPNDLRYLDMLMTLVEDSRKNQSCGWAIFTWPIIRGWKDWLIEFSIVTSMVDLSLKKLMKEMYSFLSPLPTLSNWSKFSRTMKTKMKIITSKTKKSIWTKTNFKTMWLSGVNQKVTIFFSTETNSRQKLITTSIITLSKVNIF